MNYKDIRLVALDLDDTTLRTDSSLSNATRDAICSLAALGVEIVIASGRAYSALPQAMTELSVVNFAITSNGAAINRVPDGSRVQAYTLSEHAARAALAAIPEDFVIEVFVDGTPYSDRRYVEDPVRFGCRATLIEYIQTTRKPVDDARAFAFSNIARLDSINIVSTTEERKALIPAIAAATDDIRITSGGRHLLELVDRRAGKGAALRDLCRMLGVDRSQVISFGNADNDVDMLEFAGIGVAVANSDKSCLSAADVVTASNNDDGVAQVLQEIIQSRIAPVSSQP